MTDTWTTDIRPDGFTGAVLAAEGIRDAAVLLNGPTGCKYYHGALSEAQLPRESSMDPLQFPDEFYFGQPRVPATYLDSQDYIFGATGKLEKILPRVAEKGHRLIAVVNSPGAALIGDDLERFIAEADLPVPCIAIESAGFSDSFSAGFQETVKRILEKLGQKAGSPGRPCVNLAGLSVFHRRWAGNAAELSRLLELCGIGVNSVLCAGCTVRELERFSAADADVLVYPEYADRLTPFLESRFGRKAAVHSEGAPFGFDETEKWIKGVCSFLGADPAPALEDIRMARKKAHDVLSRFNSLTGLPAGAAFALQADGSAALSLAKWLYYYLGMVPEGIFFEEYSPKHEKEAKRFLEETGCPGAWNPDPGKIFPDMVFGGEAFISRFAGAGINAAGVITGLPAGGFMEIIDRCHMGAAGALWLLEEILNAMLESRT